MSSTQGRHDQYPNTSPLILKTETIVGGGKLTPHQRPNTTDQIDQFPLHARGIIGSPERWFGRCVTPSDCLWLEPSHSRIHTVHGRALLRARNLSSDSTATALTRRIDTAGTGELWHRVCRRQDRTYRRRGCLSRKASFRCWEGSMGQLGGRIIELACTSALCGEWSGALQG